MAKGRFLLVLKFLQIFIYLAFVFLWFKDNFPPFRALSVSYFWALVPLILVTAVRIAARVFASRPEGALRWTREAAVVGVICLVTIGIRVPFLVHGQALLDSDDMIPLLSGKHIAEGQTPAIYFYGFPYEGTGAHHLYALVFKIFGYTVTGALLVALCLHLAFLCIQYLVFRELSSSASFAAAACFFYALPIGYLLAVSFHLTYPPLVLLLGSLAIYLAVLVQSKNRDDLIPLLGFCLGLAFWSHPISVYFSGSILVFLAAQWKFKARPYLRLLLYFGIGAFPVLLNEIGRDWEKFRFLFPAPSIPMFLGRGSRPS